MAVVQKRCDILNQHGSPIEIIKAFGGKADYLEALVELEQELYKAA